MDPSALGVSLTMILSPAATVLRVSVTVKVPSFVTEFVLISPSSTLCSLDTTLTVYFVVVVLPDVVDVPAVTLTLSTLESAAWTV